MNVNFSMSFQDVAEHSGKACTCWMHGSKNLATVRSVPQAHVKECQIAALYVEWTKANLELWERVKHVPVRVSGQRQLFEE